MPFYEDCVAVVLGVRNLVIYLVVVFLIALCALVAIGAALWAMFSVVRWAIG